MNVCTTYCRGEKEIKVKEKKRKHKSVVLTGKMLVKDENRRTLRVDYTDGSYFFQSYKVSV